MNKKSFVTSIIFLSLVFIGGVFSGCIDFGALNTVAASPAKKAELLQKTVDDFNQDLYWGSVELASLQVDPKIRSEFQRTYRKRREKERLVDVEVENVDYAASGNEATITIRVQYYKIPSYVVETRKEQQIWEFGRFEGGWRYLEGKEVLEDNNSTVKIDSAAAQGDI